MKKPGESARYEQLIRLHILKKPWFYHFGSSQLFGPFLWHPAGEAVNTSEDPADSLEGRNPRPPVFTGSPPQTPGLFADSAAADSEAPAEESSDARRWRSPTNCQTSLKTWTKTWRSSPARHKSCRRRIWAVHPGENARHIPGNSPGRPHLRANRVLSVPLFRKKQGETSRSRLLLVSPLARGEPSV